ncbi:DUF397 domain-containing protein [Streptomyces sp. NPDC020799]|uniref:DUF397 domain-containing protein n=1 Tax=Streptomyces sp. NPDC020799 TaxID=3365091 RepID=UPI0037B8916D
MSTNDRRPAHETDLSGACWHKSTYSSGNGACVEVATVDGIVAVRDSKDRGGPVLRFGPDEWASFLGSAAEEGATHT